MNVFIPKESVSKLKLKLEYLLKIFQFYLSLSSDPKQLLIGQSPTQVLKEEET